MKWREDHVGLSSLQLHAGEEVITYMENIKFLPVEDMNFASVVASLSETEDWGQLFTGVPEAHKHTKGEGVSVAILDTGTPNHSDITGNVIQSFNFSDSSTEFDCQGHGTHVSGIIAALENDMGIIGVAPLAKIIGVKVLGESGTGNYESIERGIFAAIDAGANVINMSLGSPVEPPDSFHAAIKQAYDKGIIIVAAAGNDAGAVNFPARYDEVIAVAAVDKNGQLARFSSRGDKVAVSAPGVDIYSTYLNNQYAVLNGTSQASPLVAGICALMLSWAKQNPGSITINNGQDMLKILDDICDPAGRIGCQGKICDMGFGIPQFANYMPWRNK